MYDRYKRVLFCAGFLLSFCFVLQAEDKGLRRVATNDCGVDNAQPFLIKGENGILPESFPGSKEAKTINVGNTLIYAFDQMDIQADYQMEVVYLADKRGEQRVVADGNEVQAPVVLEKGVERRYVIDLPKKAYAYGQLVLVFEALNGDNAVVSELNLYSSNPAPLKPFEGDRKKDLVHIQAYTVDTTVCAEKVLPIYAIKPHLVAGVYNPVLSLNGIWSFNEKPATYFYERKQMGQEWKPIVIPGQWSMQGFQVDSAAFGGYQTTFTLPADWSGKRVKLRFDGVSSESVVYLNGKEIGSHMGGMTAFELDVTNGLRSGENVLALRVRSESLADMLGSLTQYAAHQLGGITRKVTLFAVPEVHLSDLRIVTDLDDAYKDAELKVYVSVTNASANVQKNLSVRLSVSGEPVVLSQAIPEIAAGSTWSGWLTGKIASPKKWDSEHPNLYTLKVELGTSEKIVEQVKKRFGFREIQIQGNRMLVNGKAVKLKGVCRHEMHPLTGRVMNPALARKDIELYRDANCNFIRTSHYPPCEEMLEVCDELGMFVEVEAPVCWLGHHANENWKVLDYREQKYYPYVLQVNMEMIQFYRNHPSIIFWSMANESYWNKEFAQVQVYMEKADPTRPLTFHDQGYGGFNNQGSTAPISNIHYPGPDGYKVAAKSDRPMTYGEYCHLNVYNRSELVTDPGVRSDWALALAPTWENMYKTPGVLGGSIWSGIDDFFQLPNGDAVGYGAWGPIDGWRRPKPEYWDMKKIYSPIRVTTKTLSPAKELVIDLENRYTYTNLNELQVNWVYGEEKGSIFVDLEPGEKGQLRVRPVHPEKANELYLSFVDPRGFTADEYLIPVGRQIQNESQVLAAVPTRLKEKKDRYMITGKDFTCEISRISGQILSVKKGKKEVLNGGPWLMALPLTSGGCYPNHNANTPAFNDLCSDWKVEKVDAVREGNDVVVKVKGAYKEFAGSYDLKVNANGELSVVYAFDALEDVNPRQWGLVFEAPVSFDQTFWRRDGLWSVYPSDHISRPVGEASLFYEGLPKKVDPHTEPAWSWSMDYNELGSNDFRSTRRNIWYAGLRSMNGSKITVPSNGRQHWRS
ncbi:glycoside hydrolase family 2 TIM barrel-domain containing protein [Parabacteroides distasonis]|uniref:glycoside hydrolase family 2 protein n=1 Tax=Parabacteroides distasonis TaxID=823 RepID=UPI001E55A20B|nr:glycoside hydrolase family 2 TIM barrel-domain containing protein [Parabacteroides distasonis]MDB9146492.1 glycoside hydrolase family 2 TIM barrel-domain containing protein [Parabacteroides distasonis]